MKLFATMPYILSRRLSSLISILWKQDHKSWKIYSLINHIIFENIAKFPLYII